jgi:hypothetical protein
VKAIIDQEMIGEVWDGEVLWGYLRVMPSFVVRPRRRGGKVPALVSETFRILAPSPSAQDRYDGLGFSDYVAVDEVLDRHVAQLSRNEFHYIGHQMAIIWKEGQDADRIRCEYFHESRQIGK